MRNTNTKIVIWILFATTSLGWFVWLSQKSIDWVGFDHNTTGELQPDELAANQHEFPIFEGRVSQLELPLHDLDGSKRTGKSELSKKLRPNLMGSTEESNSDLKLTVDQQKHISRPGFIKNVYADEAIQRLPGTDLASKLSNANGNQHLSHAESEQPGSQSRSNPKAETNNNLPSNVEKNVGDSVLESFLFPPDNSTSMYRYSDNGPGVTAQSITRSSPNASFDDQYGVQRYSSSLDITPTQFHIPTALFQQITEKIEYGRTLARRGATYAARDEFLAALRLICDTFDQQAGSRQFSVALLEGLTALEEADEYALRESSSQIILDLSRVARGHRTQVIAPEEWERITPQKAMQRYYEYAESRLINACGRHPIASEAFYALGKSFSAPAQLDGSLASSHLLRSIIMFRVAAQINANDYKSRNELAVLLAGSGRFEDAKLQLLASLRIQPTPAAWYNLHQVHQKLGEVQLAELAMREYTNANERLRMADVSPVVRWVSPQQMNDLAPPLEQEMFGKTQVAELPAENDSKKKPRFFDSLKSRF
ncbi:MAG TPA: hypothetical protein PKD64_13940 [Pirellulaceae bacterium]|nr:hypothetical protein [Pirellulaceae bacterium]HMO93288.1 hypothetical protein [Pirellulaceae bacterium]HMP70172.1 hypothetical protein [Pirellulaceae bacterium]